MSYLEWLKSNTESDIDGFAVFEGDADQKKKREQRELIDIQLDVRLGSMRTAREAVELAKENLKKAENNRIVVTRRYQEALLEYADDEDDDYATATEKAEKFEEAETNYLNADSIIREAVAAYNSTTIRMKWELREANRLGFYHEK